MSTSKNTSRIFRSLALATTGLSLLPMSAAHAQTAAPAAAESDEAPAKDIVVTGTRIRGIAPVGAAVIQIDQAAIKATGIASTNDLLKSVPQISNIGSDEGRTGSGAGGQTFNISQSSSINLRGLGAQATLTLIDGRRPAPGGVFANLFDAATIPTIAIGNLEVLADGSSALYGSDAIAGVVNIGLRNSFNGLEANARYTTADHYSAQRYSAIAGHKWSTGHIMVAGEYYSNTSLAASARPELFIGAGTPITQIASTAATPIGYSATTTLPNFTLRGVAYAENADGTVTAGVKNIFSQWTGANYLPASKRYSFVGSFDQEITSGVDFYVQAHYSRREFSELAARGSGGGAGAASTTLTPGINNPYLTQFVAANPSLSPWVAGTRLSYSFLNSVGPSSQTGFASNWLVVGGFKVKLPSDFRADISLSHGENREHRLSTNTVNNTALTTALNATTLATAFNPFGVTPDSVLNTIRGYNNQTTGYNLTLAALKVDGSLFSLPAGSVKIAVGAEYAWNTEFIYNFATTNSAINSSGDPIVQDTGRKLGVASGYVEVVVPVFGAANAISGFQRLDLSAAVRYDRYNVQPCRVTLAGPLLQGQACVSAQPSFGTTNPKFGITWKPTNDLTVRASYGTSFRFNLLASDPNGAPLYSATGAYGDSVLGTTIAVRRGGGDINIKPETASTWTLGAEYKPEYLKGLTLSATYFNIRYNNVIGNADAVFGGNNATQSALFAPYIFRRPSKITPGADDTAFNALVATVTSSNFYTGGATAANTVAGINSVNAYIEQRNQNIGTIKTTGIDFTANYAFDLGKTSWLLGITGSKYFQYLRSLSATQPLTEVSNTIDFPNSYRLRGQLGFATGPIKANFFANYTPSYLNTYDASGGVIGNGGAVGTTVAAQATIDMSFAVDFGKLSQGAAFRDTVLSIDVINLLDKTPAYARVGAPIVQNFDSSTASGLGQQISISLRKKF